MPTNLPRPRKRFQVGRAELATEILKWDFSEQDQREMAELSAKARTGTLTAEEEAEIDSYVRVSHIANLLQAKDRLSAQGR